MSAGALEENEMKRLPRTVRVIRGSVIDLECCGDSFKLQAGQTYHDDGTTIFGDYIAAGTADGSLVEAKRDRDTIIVSARTLLKG